VPVVSLLFLRPPVHFDTDRKVDSRRLTAILYLNPSWSVSADGGALRLYPFPHSAIDISPVHDRLVLFDSARMLHRVLPSRRQRVCVTVWFWQEEGEWKATPQPCSSTTDFSRQRDAALAHLFPGATPTQLYTLTHLLSSAYLPHLARLFHTHEWFTSLEESHSPSPSSSDQLPSGSIDPVSPMLVRHLDDTEMIERALGGPLRKLEQRKGGGGGGGGVGEETNYAPDQAWRSWLPIPWTKPPVLPQHCSFVAPTRSSPEEPAAGAHTAARLVDWMGHE
jgi:hypothetical protein